MPIIFPRELPGVEYIDCPFKLLEGTKASPSGSRLINYSQVTDPAWEATPVTKLLNYALFSEVEAWWLSLRGGLRRVLFRHPHALYPKNHFRNRTPADDPGNLISVSAGNLLSVSNVAESLALSVGDRIGLERSGRFHVGRVTEVSGGGTSRQIAIEPPPFDTVAQAGAVVRFARPALVMRPVPNSWTVQQSNGLYTASFRLVESA